MMDLDHAVTRSLTVVLPESDWRALRQVEPDAIGWLQARIRERLDSLPRDTERGHRASRPVPEPANGRVSDPD